MGEVESYLGNAKKHLVGLERGMCYEESRINLFDSDVIRRT